MFGSRLAVCAATVVTLLVGGTASAWASASPPPPSGTWTPFNDSVFATGSLSSYQLDGSYDIALTGSITPWGSPTFRTRWALVGFTSTTAGVLALGDYDAQTVTAEGAYVEALSLTKTDTTVGFSVVLFPRVSRSAVTAICLSATPR